MSAPHGFVLTCSHLFDSGSDQIVVTFRDGDRYAAKIVARDRPNDLALLRIAKPNTQTILHSTSSVADSVLTCGGFGGDGEYRTVVGRLVGYAKPFGATSPSLRISGSVRQGDSGGPVTNRAGELVGVVWGVRSGVTYAAFGEPVRQILANVPSRSSLPREAAPAANSEDDTRLAAIEARIAALSPCKCPVDVATRSELNGLASISYVDAALERLDTSVERSAAGLAEFREKAIDRARSAAAEIVRERLESIDLKQVAWSKTQLVLASLGIGGPIGLAWLAGRLFLR
ncbi:MAG: serine protease, partial [Planctomycetota bacterium]